MIRVAIVDDHAMIRTGLREILKHFEDLEVVGEAGDGDEAVALVEELQPDVVLMDLVMPGRDGLSATREIVERWPNVSVVVLTTFHDAQRVRNLVDAGVRGYLMKDVASSALVGAIRTAAAGGLTLSPTAADDFLGVASPTGELPDLTPRERAIVDLVVSGATNRQIGRELGIAEKTVKTHLGRIFPRVGVKDRVGLAAWARRNLSNTNAVPR